MKNLIKEVNDHCNLFRDSKSGIAWIYDYRSGLGHSCHPNISASGSVKGMKSLGYWNKNDKTIKCNGFIYNISKFVINEFDDLDVIVANECMCEKCIKRRNH